MTVAHRNVRRGVDSAPSSQQDSCNYTLICTVRTDFFANIEFCYRAADRLPEMEAPFDWISFHGIPIIYGTQTGTARDVAEEIDRVLCRLGLQSRAVAMDNFEIVRDQIL